MTTTDYDPLLNPPLTGDDLAEIRQRIHDAARAYQQLGGTLPDPIHMALALDVPHLLGEVERLRAITAELAQADARATATRQMAVDANARLRDQLLAALGREDDGRTSLSGYVSQLAAQRDAFKLALARSNVETKETDK